MIETVRTGRNEQPAADRRLLVVHAHPDDETIGTGGTMARCVVEGVAVTLVTCTRGERGEILPEALAHLDREALGQYREGELARALGHLGVRDHLFLDQVFPDGKGDASCPVRYRDSGMAWLPDGTAGPDPDPGAGAFALADPLHAAARLAWVIRDRRPQVLVTYDPQGGYGHPDHVQAHRIATLAVELAAGNVPGTFDFLDGLDPWRVQRICWIAVPSTQAGPGERNRPVVVPDSRIAVQVEVSGWIEAKRHALRAHETQLVLSPDGNSFAFADGAAHPVRDIEYYRFAAPVPDAPRTLDAAPRGPERDQAGDQAGGERPLQPLPDLFSGLADPL